MPRDAEKIVDLGYQELQKRTKNVIIPYKKSKKTSLFEEQKQHNKTVASERMAIEHVFSKLKIFNILGAVYRNFQKKLHMRFNINLVYTTCNPLKSINEKQNYSNKSSHII